MRTERLCGVVEMGGSCQTAVIIGNWLAIGEESCLARSSQGFAWWRVQLLDFIPVSSPAVCNWSVFDCYRFGHRRLFVSLFVTALYISIIASLSLSKNCPTEVRIVRTLHENSLEIIWASCGTRSARTYCHKNVNTNNSMVYIMILVS